MKSHGFTLIELLVVIAIIGLLSSIVLASLNTARQKGNIAAVQADLSSMQTAFEMYFNSHNAYPPSTDDCSACSSPCDAAQWNLVVTALENDGDMSNVPKTDPWGNPWCYDNNYHEPNCSLDTVLYSSGPNGSNESNSGTLASNGQTTFRGDDIGVIITPGPVCP